MTTPFARSAWRVVTVAIALSAVAMTGFVDSSAFGRNVGPATPGQLNETPKALQGVGINEHLGSTVDLDLRFRDEAGAAVSLGHYVNGTKPVILDLVYYNCPSLCNFHLNGLNDAFKAMAWTVGKEFDVVLVSIDAREKPALAAKKKASYVAEYGRPEGAVGWHFLTGDEAQIQALAKQVGFQYRWDDREKQFAHASVGYVLTPLGRLSRYLYGIQFNPKTVRLSLVEAGSGQIGTIVDKLTLWCFHYDPVASKYTLIAARIMKAGGLLGLALLIAFILPFWMRRKEHKHAPEKD